MNVAELKELGLHRAANTLQEKQDRKRKMMVAYEHFRFVEPAIFDRFNAKLKEKTYKNVDYRITYDQLIFIKLAEYAEIPPADVLGKLKEAKAMNCFDTFEVVKIQTVEERPDPIIFGCISGCPDKFFVGQWDHDVKIEDILNENEG